MATRIFLRNASAPASITSGSGTKKVADLTQGSSVQTASHDTDTNPANPIQLNPGGVALWWYTPPIAGASVSSLNVTWNLWGQEPSTALNVAPLVVVEIVDLIGDSLPTPVFLLPTGNQGGGEWTASNAVKNRNTGNQGAFTWTTGVRLKISLYSDSAAKQGGTGNMANFSNGSVFRYDGGSGASGDTYVEFDATFALLAEPVFAQKALPPLTWVPNLRSNVV